MGKATAGGAPARAGDPGRRVTAEQGGARRFLDRLEGAAWFPLALFAWSLILQLLPLLGDPLAASPIGLFSYGDSPYFLESARRLAVGEGPLAGGLPLHPPLPTWLAVPAWWLLPSPGAVFVAMKIVTAICCAATYWLVYRLLRERTPLALPVALLLPLFFGELTIASAWNAEVPYRLLVASVLVLGWKRPLSGGFLNGLAALARPEHLALGLPLAAWIAWRQPERRRATGRMVVAGLVPVVFAVLLAHGALDRFNRENAAALAEPLPTWVPITAAGPLNAALGWREESVSFARQSLPAPPGQPSVLDPTFPPHYEAIVHGGRLAWREIAARPGDALARSFAKLGHSLRVLGLGWTWRDLANPPHWRRWPVDVASGAAFSWYGVLSVLMVLAGLFALRERPEILAVGLGLLAFRLAINVAFLPFLRSVLVVSPFLVLAWARGFSWPFGRHGRQALVGLACGLALLHLATSWRTHGYLLDGERDEAGSLIDDRPLEIRLDGW